MGLLRSLGHLPWRRRWKADRLLDLDACAQCGSELWLLMAGRAKVCAICGELWR